MQRSTDRILVTHVGSLVRPMSIRNILSARDYGEPHDETAYVKTLRDEVAGVVRKQAEAGVDIVSDGEYGKAGWIRYVSERLGGFVHREFRKGDREQNPVYLIREAEKFGDFYAAYTPIQYYDWLPPGSRVGRLDQTCPLRKNIWYGNAWPRSPTRGRLPSAPTSRISRPRSERHEGHRSIHAGRGAAERARPVAQRLLSE